MTDNITVRLAKRPTAMVTADCFAIAHEPIRQPDEGEVLVRVDYISLDPAMRGWLNEGKSYIPPVGIGEIMRAGSVGEVLASGAPGINVGDFVSGTLGVQSHYTGTAQGLTKIDPKLAPLPRYLGGLGMPGMTAYFGLLETGAYKDGETVVVSGASGAVGALVGQIAKLKGGKVIGIAGGADKCRYCVEELGFDACIDYKSEDVNARLSALLPKGLDVYFDNVGGDILEACMNHLRPKARIVICGAIASYNDFSNIKGPRNYLNLLVYNARMEGFVVFNFADRYAEGAAAMIGWMEQGKLKFREDIQQGIERFPEILNMLFSGANFGKLILKV
jgi:NADPH-dependent curcumin reductase